MTLKKLIGIVSSLPSEYVPPNCHHVSGDILTSIYDTNMDQEMKSLVLHAEIFDVTLFGGVATIKTSPMVNDIGAGVHNNFSMLDVFDCSDQYSNGGKKYASYIARMFLPLV